MPRHLSCRDMCKTLIHWVITIKVKAKWIFTRFQLWAPNPFVKFIPGFIGQSIACPNEMIKQWLLPVCPVDYLHRGASNVGRFLPLQVNVSSGPNQRSVVLRTPATRPSKSALEYPAREFACKFYNQILLCYWGITPSHYEIRTKHTTKKSTFFLVEVWDG